MPFNDESISELLRPRQLGDLTLPQSTIDRLQRMVDRRRVMNLLFYGRPGLGKTSAARIIYNAVGKVAYMEIVGARLTSAEALRQQVEAYACCMSLWGGTKICFIDEADTMSKAADAALRPLIERVNGNCSFILATNERSKLSSGLLSRLLQVSFDVKSQERDAIIKRWQPRYEARLSELGVKYDKARLDQIISIYFPDLRRIAGMVEFEFC